MDTLRNLDRCDRLLEKYLKKEDIVSLQQSMGNFDSTFKEVMTFFQEMNGNTVKGSGKGKNKKKH